jgi:hypothetical protein
MSGTLTRLRNVGTFATWFSAKSQAVAFPALPVAGVRIHVSVLWREFVSMFAVRPTATWPLWIWCRASLVYEAGNGFQVSRIDAHRVTAQVVNLHAIGDRANSIRVGKTVSGSAVRVPCATDRKRAVAAASVRALPRPAFIWAALIGFGPEALFNRRITDNGVIMGGHRRLQSSGVVPLVVSATQGRPCFPNFINFRGFAGGGCPAPRLGNSAHERGKVGSNAVLGRGVP